MKRTIYLCGLFRYPRGNATANYMQYLSEALKRAGYNVILICSINNEFSLLYEYEYCGTKVYEVMHKGPVPIFNRLMNGKLFKIRLYMLLNHLDISENDLVISPQDDVIRKPILRLQKRRRFKTCGYIAEWFDRSLYSDAKKAERANIQFYSNGDLDLIFPISHYIAKQFEGRKCKITVLPIMADSQEYPFVEKLDGPYHFILPAMGIMKDALGSMMLGLTELTENELKDITFHITGISKDTVRKIVGERWNKIEGTLVFHEWMKYENLIKLYHQCHYLFLARETNRTTLSNFPSKVPETMTHGIVPVCSEVGDYTKYYLKDGVNSIVFSGCTPEICRDALRRAIYVSKEDYRVLSQNARKCVVEKFDYRNWVEYLHDNIEFVFR